MRRIALLLTVILLLVLPSCSPSNDFQGGRPITKEDLESVSASLFTTIAEPEDVQTTAPPSAETTTPSDTDATTVPDTDTDTTVNTEPTETGSTDTVYWLSSGSVYHLDPDCSHIAGKENINQTTVQEAEENGRRLCKTCEKKHQGE